MIHCSVCTTVELLSAYALRSTSLYHSRQRGIIFKPCSDRTDYTVVVHDALLQLKIIVKQYQCAVAVLGPGRGAQPPVLLQPPSFVATHYFLQR